VAANRRAMRAIVLSVAIGILVGVGFVIYARSTGNGEGPMFVLLGFCGLAALAGAVQFTRLGRTARVEQALAAGASEEQIEKALGTIRRVRDLCLLSLIFVVLGTLAIWLTLRG
jgi:hypothetical protein